jgi:hypothetical protein
LDPQTLIRGSSADQAVSTNAAAGDAGPVAKGPIVPSTNTPHHSRRSVWLLILILVFLIFNPLLEKDQMGEAIILVSMYATLISATRALSEKTRVRWPPTLLATASMLAMAIAHFFPYRPLWIVNWAILAVFFGFISVGFFSYLGRPGAVTDDRIFVSVSLYLLLGMLWFSLYNLLEAVHPGSFALQSTPLSSLPRGTLIYLSLATLTTLGYGDIVPVTPIARMVAALEAVAGVLYIAITVARLVSGYRGDKQEAM